MRASDELIKAFGVTLEITDTPPPSKGAATAMIEDLATYPEPQVLAALRRCCRELKGRLTLADILTRIEDGRPAPEAAWGMVPKDEGASVVWTTEMREAYESAYSQITVGDLIPARMAFLESYRVLVQKARDSRLPVEWVVSLGHDNSGRELVLLDAAEKGRISQQNVRSLLPYHRDDEALNARLLALEGKSAAALLLVPSEAGNKVLADLRAKFPVKTTTRDKAA